MAIVASGGSWAAWWFASLEIACWALIAVGALQIVNSALRLRLKHHLIPKARRQMVYEFLLGFVLPVVVGVSGLVADLPAVSGVTSTAIAFVGIVVLALVELDLADKVAADERRTSVSAYIGSCNAPYKIISDDPKSVVEAVEVLETARVVPPLAWLFEPIWGLNLSGARWVMILALVVPTAAFGAGGLSADRGTTPRDKPAGTGAPSKKPGDPDPSGDSQPGPSSKPSEESDRSDRCTTLPGDGLPSSLMWMREDFAALFGHPSADSLEASEPLPLAGKCFDRAQVGRTDDFAYQVQRYAQTQQVASVAVHSVTQGPALYYWPAASNVLDLIERYGLLGGPSQISASPGDLYLVRVAQGTIVLIRRRGNKPSGDAQPYLELPPSVAAAWQGQMREREAWLWPVEERNPDGTTTYHLVPDAEADVASAVGAVEYDPDTDLAQTQTGQFGPEGVYLRTSEITLLAASAG